jgi:manganese efflux pump family protein
VRAHPRGIGKDDGMRRITAGAAGTLAAALVCAAWWLGAGQALATTPPSAGRSAHAGSTAACYAFAVGALRQRVVVRHIPAACDGLTPAQVNQAVGRAIRTVAGPLPKAAARRQDLADSRYLAVLVRQGRPPPPASLATGGAEMPDTLALRLAALAVWLAAALAGGYLLVGRRRPASPRPIRALGLAGGHAGLAAAGLAVWVGFVVTEVPALGWTDVVLTWLIAGLGMATLLGDGSAALEGAAPVPAAAGASTALVTLIPARAPVLMIALHGALAGATIVLVLLAVIAAG